MKATDLMIGDWVHCITDNTIVQIEEMFIDEIYGWCYKYEGKLNALKDIEPIPLTPEFLKKNGFECRGAQFICDHICMIWWKDNIFMFSKYMRHEDLPAENVSINIGYVHELQHALRLCGIEKEIEL